MLQYTECETKPSKGKYGIKINKTTEDRKDEECQNSNGSWCLVSPSLISDIKNHQKKQSCIKMLRKQLEYRNVLIKNLFLFMTI